MSQAVYEKIRDKYKQVCESSNPRPDKYIARIIGEAIGLIDPKTGKHHQRPDGAPMLAKDRKEAVDTFRLEAVTKALLGHEWQQVLIERNWVSEEAAAPIGPSHLMNVSAWTATVGGLVKGSILEGYETTDFELIDLFPVRPLVYWQGGERYTAIIGPSRPAPKVGPGQSHPDVRVDAMWVEPGPMSKYGHKITVAKETAVTDITGGQVLAAAKDLGTGLRYREHELILDVVCGQSNNFKLGLTADGAATGYNTYGPTVPAGPGTTATLANDIVNPISSDPMTVFNTTQAGLLGYKHPVTGLPMPMADRLTTFLFPSNIQWFATYLNTVQNVTLGSQPAAPASQIASSAFPTGWATAPNPFAGLAKSVRVSQWLYNRHIASATQTDPDLSPGLGLTAGPGGTGGRWYRLDPERFACRRMGWDVSTTEINPSTFTMTDQNLIFGAVANIAIQVQVLSPWAIQRNRTS